MKAIRMIAGAALAACAVGCGGGLNSPDPYQGTAYAQGFDLKFQSVSSRTLCPSGNCYPVVKGWAKGKNIYMYQLGALASKDATGRNIPQGCPGTPPQPWCVDSGGNVIFLTSLATNHVFEFTPSQCAPNPNGYDITNMNYDPTTQYPVMTQLPLAGQPTAPPVIPVAAVTTVSGVNGDNCNDIKQAPSIEGQACKFPQDCVSGNCSNFACVGGRFGATSPTGVDHYAFYAAIDMDAAIAPLTAADGTTVLPSPEQFAWVGNLQSAVLNGGKVPTGPDQAVSGTTLLAMDGVIVDGATKNAFVTDPGVILLPFAPGDPGYSPIVRLHDYQLQGTEKVGTYKGVCSGASCTGAAASILDLGKTVAVPQQGLILLIAAVGQ